MTELTFRALDKLFDVKDKQKIFAVKVYKEKETKIGCRTK